MTTTTADLAVAICTLNNMRTIQRLLESVAGLAKRTVVIDCGSTDGTIELCQRFGAEVIHRDWGGYVAQRQYALDQCRDHRWVLLLDSDESLELELRSSIIAAIQSGDAGFDGWMINRKVWFEGGWLHHVFQPEWRLRLVRGAAARVVGRDPHNRVEVPGRVGKLRGDLRHDSWIDLPDMLRRGLAYARQAADAGAPGGSAWKLLTSGAAATLKQLIVKQGWRDGTRGLIVSVGVGVNATVKQLLIAQRDRMASPDTDRR